MKRFFYFFLLLLLPFAQAGAQNIDIDILRHLNGPFEHDLGFWEGLSNTAYSVPAAYLATNVTYGLIKKDDRAKKFALEFVISAVISQTVTHSIKHIVSRPRPVEAYPDIIRAASFADGRSLPSGHASLSFVTATTMAYQGEHWYVTAPAAAWASTIGYSRMRLGMHYPSDVLAGAIIGVGSGILGHWLTGKIVHRKEDKAPEYSVPSL